MVISDTSTSQKLKHFVVAVTWLCNVDIVFSLRPQDTPDIGKFGDKGIVHYSAQRDVIAECH